MIIGYFPFYEVNLDSLKSNKTESEPDNNSSFIFLTNVQIFQLLSNESIPNEEHSLIKISEPNDVHPNSSCHLGVTNNVGPDVLLKNNEPAKVQQSTLTESNSIVESVTNTTTASYFNKSMQPGTRTSAGMGTTWEVSTYNPISKNDSHVLTSTPINKIWNNKSSSSTTKTNFTILNVTTPLCNTNHTTSDEQYEKTNSSTQKNISLIYNFTPPNGISSKTTLTKPKLELIKSENKSVIIHINHYSKEFYQFVILI